MATPKQAKPSPRAALARWRGLKLADDLVLTRKRVFYRIAGVKAEPLSIEEVAANYNLEALQAMYRVEQESWKTMQRTARRRANA
jgi:hypothetical protein